MSKSKSKALLLTFTVVVVLAGLSSTSLLQTPQTVYSQTDYEEYLIMETNTEQELNQQNIGSGSSSNINCGTNIAGTNLLQPISCPSVPGETPSPSITVRPVVTQRLANVSINPSGTTSAEAQCNPDEVVTGGGYSFSEIRRTGSSGGGGSLPPTVFITTSFKTFAQNNAWHIEIVNPNLTGTVQVYAECLKLVPA
jgi:hypothetical protein